MLPSALICSNECAFVLIKSVASFARRPLLSLSLASGGALASLGKSSVWHLLSVFEHFSELLF